MTTYFVQRVDDDRQRTPRPAFCSGQVDDGWVVLMDAPSHAAAAELAYRHWQSQRLGLVGFIELGEQPAAPGPKTWKLKVWEHAAAAEAKIYAVSHAVTTTYYVTEETP